MAYALVAQGNVTTPLDLQAAGEAESYLNEGDMAELRLYFKWRFPLFENLAGELNDSLISRGVTPWHSGSDIVSADPKQAIWYIRYRKGIAWLAFAIIGVLLSLAVIVLLNLWKLYKVVERLLGPASEVVMPVLVIMASVWLGRRILRTVT